MLRKVKFYSTYITFGLIILLFFAGSRYVYDIYYRNIETQANIHKALKVEYGVDSYPQDIASISNNFYATFIEEALNQTRKQIKAELSTYDFSQSGVNVLEDVVMESGGKPLQSLIVSTWRSGTTFLGEILHAIPGSYYDYEPLIKYGPKQIRGPPESDRALRIIKNIFKCNFYGMKDYFLFGSKFSNQFTHNTKLWDYCKLNMKPCLDPDFTSQFCKLFPFHIMKVVRLRLEPIQHLLDDKEFNVKMILLTRDPRGVMNSRRLFGHCLRYPDCGEPSLLCADMISNYEAAGRILQQYPDRLMVIRYEELALQPNITTHRILKFLRLSATQSVDEFLKMHTSVSVADIYSTYRITREVPFRWKSELDFSYVDKLQTACNEAMLLWGYKMAYNETHMRSKDFNPLGVYTVPM